MDRILAEPDFKALFEDLPCLYLILDPSLRIVAASNAYLKATSTQRAEIVGRYASEVFPDSPGQPLSDGKLVRASLERVLDSRAADSFMVRRPDARDHDPGGETRTREWILSTSPILHGDGSVAYLIHRTEDVTDIVLRSRALPSSAPPSISSDDSETTRQLAGLAQGQVRAKHVPIPMDVQAPHILIVENDPDMNAFLAHALGRHYWISRASDAREGVEKSIGSDRPDLIIADAAMGDMSGLAMADALRSHSELEDVPIVMITTVANAAMRVQLMRHGIQDYLNKPFSVDELLARVQSLLGKWRRAGQRLRQSEEHYRTLFSSIDEGFCIVEMIFDEAGKAIDYVYLETNPSFEKQTGLVEAQGRRMRELAPAHEEYWFEIYGNVATTGEPIRFERYAAELGRWFDVFAFRYGDRENRQVAILFNDITTRIRTEQELQEADRRKDEFLALLAHELRNPLAPIRNAVQILRMAPTANSGRPGRLLPMMERQLGHMARLLDDLLDVSRIAHGTVELRKERFDVKEAVKAALEASEPLIDSMGHQLSVSLPAEAVLVDADPVRLTQIISNLLNNAAHYSTPGGQIALSVACDPHEVRLVVKDRGVGIRPEDLEGIFGLFVQLGPAVSRRAGGLGIGLSLVRKMVNLHGGTVEAHSAGPGQGSEFIVRLPVGAGPAQQRDQTGGDSP